MPRPLLVTVLAILALAAPFAPQALAQTEEDAAPTVTFQFTLGAVVGDVVSFAAKVQDEDAANATVEWDFAYDGENFTVDAVGVTADHVFATPGFHSVAARATDAGGNEAVAVRSVPIDDFFTVLLEILNTPTKEESLFARLTITDWQGQGVENQSVTIGIFYQPQRDGIAHLIRTVSATTEEEGVKYFPIPRDTSLGNIPGRHVASVNAQIGGTALGDTESVTFRLPYAIPL